jgi:hypothetical protein
MPNAPQYDQYNVSSTIRRTIRADKKGTDATWTLLNSFQEANRIVAEHLVVSQAGLGHRIAPPKIFPNGLLYWHRSGDRG